MDQYHSIYAGANVIAFRRNLKRTWPSPNLMRLVLTKLFFNYDFFFGPCIVGTQDSLSFCFLFKFPTSKETGFQQSSLEYVRYERQLLWWLSFQMKKKKMEMMVGINCHEFIVYFFTRVFDLMLGILYFRWVFVWSKPAFSSLCGPFTSFICCLFW